MKSENRALKDRMHQLAEPSTSPDGTEKRLLSISAIRAIADEFEISVSQMEILALSERIVPARYERSQGTVGWDGQIRLLESTVAVVGCGGLGGWIIEGLARMGVGHLILVDGDEFEENNLNRQLLCTEGTLGRPKVEVAHQRVMQVNSAVQVTAFHTWVDEENLPQIICGAQVAVDALDTLSMRLSLQRATAKMGIPMVHGAIAGMMGQVMTILPGDRGLLHLHGEAEPPDRGMETQWGNPAATPMMVASWEVHEVIKLLLGKGDLIRDRMLLMDAEAGFAEIICFTS